MIKFSRATIFEVEEEDLREQLTKYVIENDFVEDDENILEEIKTLPAKELVEEYFFRDWDEDFILQEFDFDVYSRDIFEEI